MRGGTALSLNLSYPTYPSTP